LARYFKTSPRFWPSLQRKYDVEAAEDKGLEKIERDAQPFEAAAG